MIQLQTIPDADIYMFWVCRNEECDWWNKEITRCPSSFESNGNPVCDECGQDLAYSQTAIVIHEAEA